MKTLYRTEELILVVIQNGRRTCSTNRLISILQGSDIKSKISGTYTRNINTQACDVYR